MPLAELKNTLELLKLFASLPSSLERGRPAQTNPGNEGVGCI